MLKKIVIYSVIIFLSLMAGCKVYERHSISKNRIDKFPQFLVGTWKTQDSNENNKWSITFNKTGKITSFTNFWATDIIVSEGGVYERFPDPNKDFALTLGPTEVNYIPENRMLMVRIFTDYFMLHSYETVVEGSGVDTLSGIVSKDGLTWNAEWKSYSRLIDDPPIDFNKPDIKKIILYKEKKSTSK